MVQNEPQRTHMSFDGLSDMFGALGTEIICGKVEGRQRPHGGDGLSNSNGTCWLLCWFVLLLSTVSVHPFIGREHATLFELPACREHELPHIVAADIQTRQRPDGGMDGAGVSKMYIQMGLATYWHLGRKAATIIAPEAPNSLPLKSASVMVAFMVTACLSPKVMVSSALMVERPLAQM